KKFIEKEGLNFDLLSDEDRTMMEEWCAFGEKKNYGKVVQGVIRSTVVVDAEGQVALAQYNVNATGHVARVRKALGIDAAWAARTVAQRSGPSDTVSTLHRSVAT